MQCDLTSLSCQLRLCVALIIFSAPALLALIATECSTFVHVNSGTSKRSHASPDGDLNQPSVRNGNALAAHSCLLLLILCLLRRTFLLEQPGSSVLMLTSRMQWLIEVLAKQGVRIFKQAFWMAAFGHSRPKRTVLWGNNPIVRLFRTDKVAKTASGPAVVKSYLKKDGTRGYSGDPKRLKKTEQLDCTYIFNDRLV